LGNRQRVSLHNSVGDGDKSPQEKEEKKEKKDKIYRQEQGARQKQGQGKWRGEDTMSKTRTNDEDKGVFVLSRLVLSCFAWYRLIPGLF
jgi:hypothetical protein